MYDPYGRLQLLNRLPDIRFEEKSTGYNKAQVDQALANLADLIATMPPGAWPPPVDTPAGQKPAPGLLGRIKSRFANR